MLLPCKILSLVHTQLLLSYKLQYVVIAIQIYTLVGQALSYNEGHIYAME